MEFTKTSESPAFVAQFVHEFFDRELRAPLSPEAKLLGFQKLQAGWYSGRGNPIDEKAIRIAHRLLRCANGGIIDKADVFPHPAGGVTVAIYFSKRDLAFTIRPDGTVDVDSESDPNFPLLEGLSPSHALFIIQALARQWNSYSFSTFPNTTRTSILPDFEAPASRDQVMELESQFSRGNVLRKQQVPYVLTPALSMPR
jgi:hypothetical protein